MSLSPRSEGRKLKAFRLADVPLGVRLRAMVTLIDSVKDPLDALEYGCVAREPSDAIYFVSVAAWNEMMASAEKASRKPKAKGAARGRARRPRAAAIPDHGEVRRAA
jgi:hypothetical protein